MVTLDDLNEDWIKMGHWDLPTDVIDHVLRFAKYPGEPMQEAAERFAWLPAAQPMPNNLRKQLTDRYGVIVPTRDQLVSEARKNSRREPEQ